MGLEVPGTRLRKTPTALVILVVHRARFRWREIAEAGAGMRAADSETPSRIGSARGPAPGCFDSETYFMILRNRLTTSS